MQQQPSTFGAVWIALKTLGMSLPAGTVGKALYAAIKQAHDADPARFAAAVDAAARAYIQAGGPPVDQLTQSKGFRGLQAVLAGTGNIMVGAYLERFIDTFAEKARASAAQGAR